MKQLRFAIFMMVMSGAALLPMRAYGQQEVDPDHFDHPAAAGSVQKAKPAVHHHAASNAKMASHHHSSKGSHSARNS